MNRRYKRKPTRREAIALVSGCAALPFTRSLYNTLVKALADGVIAKAHADAAPSSTPPRNYFYISMNGGPARAYFDLPLAAYDASIAVHPHFNTKLVGGVPQYVSVPFTVNGTTVHMPSLWQSQIPVSGGGTAPMSVLLQHMLMIRGVNLGSDGHNLNNGRQIQPISTTTSLTGAVADKSPRPIAAVGLEGGPWSVFRSATGAGQITAPYSDASALPRLLGAFDRSGDALPSSFTSRRDALASVVNSAMTQLGAYANSSRPGAGSLFDMRHSAQLLLEQGVNNLSSSFNAIRDKYDALINRSMDWQTLALPGITDTAVSSNALLGALGPKSLNMSSGGDVTGLSDFRQIIRPNSEIYGLPGVFALAEFLITRGYTSSVCGGFGGMFNVGPNADLFWGLDEHEGGAAPSMFVNAFFFRAIAACLHEFITTMKSNNIFDETVIHLGGDFNRDPSSDGAEQTGGSNHGWMCSNTSLFSGAITQPLIVGNTYKTRLFGGVRIPKAWGLAAPVLVDGSMQTLTPGHMTSTVAELLRVDRPMQNNGSLVQENASGGITPLVETAKNV